MEGYIFARKKLDEVSLRLYRFFLTLWAFFTMRRGDTRQGFREEGRISGLETEW